MQQQTLICQSSRHPERCTRLNMLGRDGYSKSSVQRPLCDTGLQYFAHNSIKVEAMQSKIIVKSLPQVRKYSACVRQHLWATHNEHYKHLNQLRKGIQLHSCFVCKRRTRQFNVTLWPVRVCRSRISDKPRVNVFIYIFA